MKEQVEMVTNDIFGTIYRSQQFIIKHLMDGGSVFNLQFGDYTVALLKRRYETSFALYGIMKPKRPT